MNVFEPRAHHNLIIIMCRLFVAHVEVSDRDVAILMLLHITIAKTELAHQLYASDLKPDCEIGVIDHAHAICFGIAHAQFDFAGGVAHSLDFAYLLFRFMHVFSLRSRLPEGPRFASASLDADTPEWVILTHSSELCVFPGRRKSLL